MTPPRLWGGRGGMLSRRSRGTGRRLAARAAISAQLGRGGGRGGALHSSAGCSRAGTPRRVACSRLTRCAQSWPPLKRDAHWINVQQPPRQSNLPQGAMRAVSIALKIVGIATSSCTFQNRSAAARNAAWETRGMYAMSTHA